MDHIHDRKGDVEYSKATSNDVSQASLDHYQTTTLAPPPLHFKAQSSEIETTDAEKEEKNTQLKTANGEGGEGLADPPPKPNSTGLPTQLKSGIENLSGFSLDGVKVYRNSDKPAQLQAHAYAQGTDIHLGPGQEEHLPHEAWHVVQQMQGRVQPTTQLKAFNINDDAGLEKEADVMGDKAMNGNLPSRASLPFVVETKKDSSLQLISDKRVIQLLKKGDLEALGIFGLDVDSWEEFIDKIKNSSVHFLSMVSQKLDKLATTEESWEARKLIERRKSQLRGSSKNLVDHWFGTTSPPRSTIEEAETLFDETQEEQRIVICDGTKKMSIIRSTSELMVWLVSNPTLSKDTPKDFLNSKFLSCLLSLLYQKDKVLHPLVVWEVVNKLKTGDIEVADEEMEWSAEGEWGERVMKTGEDKLLGISSSLVTGFEMMEEVPLEFRRKIPRDEYLTLIEDLKAKLSGHKFVGVHGTTVENVGPLMTEGVSEQKINTGNGIGKGRGFYIIPSKTGLAGLSKADKSAKGWETHTVAVYLPNDCERVVASSGQNIETLEMEHERSYYEFGDAETVIPVSLYPDIILVRDPADIAVASDKYEAESTEIDPLAFLVDF